VEQKGAPAYVAELVGTFVLVLFITLAVSISSSAGLGFTDWAVIGLVHALALAALIAALAGASGGHFNPAVTVTLAAMRKIRPADAAVYVLMQLAGATLAAVIVRGLLEDEGEPVNWGATLIAKSFFQNDFSGFVAEGLGAFALMLAIVGTAVIVKNKSSLAPWVIGGALGMAVMAIGPMTGGGINPARAFGPLLVSGALWDNIGTFLFVYTAGPIVGALLAGFVVLFIYRDDLQEAEAVLPPREDIVEVPVDEVRDERL
jgi:MIP family channel proteins